VTRDEARRRAEEALAKSEQRELSLEDCYLPGSSRADAAALRAALRALLAAEPEGKTCGSISTVRSDATPAQPLPTCANCGSNLIAPVPSPARDEVREAAEEALGVLTDLAESAAYWSEYDVPLGIVSRVDFAKARLAAALAAKGGA